MRITHQAYETASLPKQAFNPREKKIDTVEDVPETNSVPFSPNQNFNAHNVGSEQKNFDGVAYKRKGRKDGNSRMRPGTRSLIRKRALARVQLANTKIDLSSRQKHGDRIFSFGEGRSAKLDGAVNTGSLLPIQKKIEKKSSKIDPYQMSSPVA
ncbi:hypothetical protein V6N13_071292 [Hibiscus sabdariffa]